QGVISHLYGAIAGRKPGVITKVGLHTFVDPRLEGGKVNDIAKDDLVQVIELLGEEWLFYPRLDINVSLVRGSTADTNGNIVMDQEPAILEAISIAQAAKACGGFVIAQVKHLAEAGSLDPRQVKIPGIYVDHIVVDKNQMQTVEGEYNHSFSGEIKIPLEGIELPEMDIKKVIGVRAARELFKGAVVNLGFGVPSYVSAVASEQGMLEDITFTVEQGIVGGMPAGGVIFGVAYNPEAIIGEDYQFTFYDGGGLDLAFLGMAQFDQKGNVNVSKVGPMLTGCGGFINITQSARKVIFCGTFTTKGLRCDIGSGQLKILSEGKVKKLVPVVSQVTFSGDYA
ncbi:MAG: acyl CoA:acetate/3-ketoacid CoA transferase, partial [Deltaproteobacteria bacterium]|nr:acyl CoA:acetate/3-ketoacid CoA transferase [Deltaproteobacteria bacterium]